MTEDVREAVAGIVLHISAGKKTPEDSVCLYHDLKISGDDADELLGAVQKKFGTKFEGFKFAEYFPNEPEAIFHHMGNLVGMKNKFKRFPFGHLVAVVKAGNWFEPEQTVLQK